MIDHISIGVRELASAREFYSEVLAPLDARLLVDMPTTAGFGKKQPQFWLNHRPDLRPAADDTGCHICLRAADIEAGQRAHAIALSLGASCFGEPGPSPHYHASYYAGFFQDPDGNRIEIVTFTTVPQET